MGTDTEPVETEEVQTEEAATEVPVETETKETPTPIERPQKTRQDRKRERIDVEAANRERDEIKQRLEREATERQRLANEIAELKARDQARQQQTQQQDKNTQTKNKIAELRKQAKSHLFFSSQAKDAAQAEKEWDRYQELMDEADDLRDEIRATGRWEKQRTELSTGRLSDDQIAERAFLDAKFPWLSGSPEGQALSDARIRTIAASGRQINRETVVEAITWAAQQLKLGGNGTQPTNGQRQLYTGIPSGEGAGNGDSRKTIKMGRDEEALARAAYPHLEAKDAYKQWAKDMVSRMNRDE